FAASEIKLTDEEMASFKVKPLIFPTLVGGIVPVYNLPEVGQLQFTGEALAGIFSGKIKTWNDPAMASANPNANLPAAKIGVVHRTDSSGSTWTFTEFLSLASPGWQKSLGQGGTVNWPVGEGARGSKGVSEKVKSTPYSIGYVEQNFAEEYKLSYGP